jgi:hypothetical protein
VCLTFSLPAFAQNDAPPKLPAPVDMGAVTGALNDDGKDKPQAKTPTAPRRSAEDIRREAADNKEWQQIRLAAKADLAENPAQAIDTFKRFFGSRALHPNVGVAVTAAIAELYVGLKDEANASRIYDWAAKEYQGVPAAARLVPGRAALLRLQKKPGEAATLLNSEWDNVMREAALDASFAKSALEQKVELSRERKKPEEAIVALQNALAQSPVISSTSTPEGAWLFQTLTDLLLEAKRGQDAVGVARLAFEQCGFDKYNIEAASVFLTRVWRKHDPTGKEVEAFAAAQSVAADSEGGKKANPLFNYPLPKVETAVWQDTLKQLPQGSTRLRINVLIAAGEYGTAMQEAEAFHAQYGDKGGASATIGIIEACRVLKAADLNLVRANALLAFLQTKQGENPLPGFYKQYPPRKDESAAASGGGDE